MEGLNRDLKRAQELTKDSKTTVKVYVDPATIKEIAGGFEGIRQDTSKLLDVVEAVLPPELKPQVLSIRWVKQELLAQGYSETKAWELANNPNIRVWMQNEREAEALVQKYGSVENIPETARAEFYNTIARNFKSENIDLTQFPDAAKVVRCDFAQFIEAIAPQWGPAILGGATWLAIVSREKITKAVRSAGEAFKNFEENVKQKVTELQNEGKLPGYGDTGEQPVTTTPPQRQTTVNAAPGGTADHSGAVAPLPGGASVAKSTDDSFLPTPGVMHDPSESIIQETNNQFEDQYGVTPHGRIFTKHYGTETGPTRNLPGSVIDNTIETTIGLPAGGGKTVYYDPVNNVTVVTGSSGKIVSARKGKPRGDQVK